MMTNEKKDLGSGESTGKRRRSRFSRAQILAVIGEFRSEDDPSGEELRKVREIRKKAEEILERRAREVEQDTNAKASSVLAKMTEAAGEKPTLAVVKPSSPRQKALDMAEVAFKPAAVAPKPSTIPVSPPPATRQFESLIAPERQPDRDDLIAQAKAEIAQKYGAAVQFVVALLRLAMNSPLVGVHVNRVLIYAIKPLQRELTRPGISADYAHYMEQIRNTLQAHIDAVNRVLEDYFGYALDECKAFPKNQEIFQQIRVRLLSDSEFAPVFVECFELESQTHYLKRRENEKAERAAVAAKEAEKAERAAAKSIARTEREAQTLAFLISHMEKMSAEAIAKRIVKKYGDAPSAKEGIIRAAIGQMLLGEQIRAHGQNGNQIQEIAELATKLAAAAGINAQELDVRVAAHKEKEAEKASAQRQSAERAISVVPIDYRSPGEQTRAHAAGRARKSKKSDESKGKKKR